MLGRDLGALREDFPCETMKRRIGTSIAIAIVAIALIGCSSGPDLPPLKVVSPVAPTPECALNGAYRAADREKLTGAIEISDVRQGKSFGPGAFMLCLRGSPSEAVPVRTYATFFDNDNYKGVRGSVILDECEKQAFHPLPPKPTDVDKLKDSPTCGQPDTQTP